MSKSISFHSEGVDFHLDNEKKIVSWIKKSIKNESKNLGELSYIFCSDDYLLNLNQQYLNHNTYTDIITFDYTEKGVISGDIFISIDRVKENATKYKVNYSIELARVIIHGALHLMGYKDKKPTEKEVMRSKEDFYLTLLQ